jgi:hypothetical protein
MDEDSGKPVSLRDFLVGKPTFAAAVPFHRSRVLARDFTETFARQASLAISAGILDVANEASHTLNVLGMFSFRQLAMAWRGMPRRLQRPSAA